MSAAKLTHSMTSYRPLQNKIFRQLFGAQVISLVGTGLSTVALTLLAWDLVGGQAGVVLGTALAFKMLAYVVFAPIVGGFAHRLPRKAMLVTLDILRAGVVLAMPFVTRVWEVYLLIFLLNLLSAGFKPVFQALIPEVLGDDETYTRALSLSRIAYDLENLLSPVLAGVALLVLSYDALFLMNAGSFLVSGLLILVATLPGARAIERPGSAWNDVSFGLRAYLRTPRLVAVLLLYMAVAAASAMVIVNTVVYVREFIGGSSVDTAMALAAAGGGSMLAALTLPRLLARWADRQIMLAGSVLMGLGLGLVSFQPSLGGLMALWFVVGTGWSLVQTPAGRIVIRSASPADRPAYFAAQFSLSHLCWLLAYPVAGQLGATAGLGPTALVLCGVIWLFTLIAWIVWPKNDPTVLYHVHDADHHGHLHTHDGHHAHLHRNPAGPEPHSHEHDHPATRHAHAFVIDDHHADWPDSQKLSRG